jgi:hypothetical protein
MAFLLLQFGHTHHNSGCFMSTLSYMLSIIDVVLLFVDHPLAPSSVHIMKGLFTYSSQFLWKEKS